MGITRELHKSEIEYKSQRDNAFAQLEEIHNLICEKMDADEARTPTYWTHAGSMEHVNSLLAEVIQFIS